MAFPSPLTIEARQAANRFHHSLKRPVVLPVIFRPEIEKLAMLLGGHIGLPIVLLWSGLIPFASRFHVLAAVLIGFLISGCADATVGVNWVSPPPIWPNH